VLCCSDTGGMASSLSVPVGDNPCWATSSAGGLGVRDNLNAAITEVNVDVTWAPMDVVSCCSGDDGVTSP